MQTIRITLTPESLADLDAICKRSGYSRSEQVAGMIEAAKEEEAEILRRKEAPEGSEREMADKFKVGDVVRLKSGGRKMTVAVVRDGLVLVHWTDDSGVHNSLQIEECCFVAAEP